MGKSFLFSTILVLAIAFSVKAQVTILPNNLGVNTVSPLSAFSVNDDGDARYGIYSLANSSASGNAGVVGEGITPSTFGGSTFGVRGNVPVGSGFTYGVYGDATDASPSADGRAYGVYGRASNADFNAGVYGRLDGSNQGTAVIGVDYISNPAFDETTLLGTWAGYFVGNSYFSDKVTIGTTNMPTMLNTVDLTDYRLFVCGGILANEWLVPNASWCDYVFEEDYELLSLPEVAQHIEEKGHLHNTPSASEIESGGLEVATITINQQEKIEELFLHMIEMNERLENLEKRNGELEAENEHLKAMLKN